MNYMSWNELLMIIVLSGWDQSLKHMVFLWGHFNLCAFVFSVKMRECRVWKAKEQSYDDVTANKKVQRRKCKVVKEKERNWRTTSSRRVHVPFIASTLWRHFSNSILCVHKMKSQYVLARNHTYSARTGQTPVIISQLRLTPSHFCLRLFMFGKFCISKR